MQFFKLRFFRPISILNFLIQFRGRIDCQHGGHDDLRVNLVEYLCGVLRPYFSTARTINSCEIKKIVIHVGRIQPLALLNDLLCSKSLMHERQRLIVTSLNAYSNAVITKSAKFLKLLCGFGFNISDAGKAANRL